MPIFYFHISDGHLFAEDVEGRDLPDAEAARRVAIEGARGIMAEELRGGELNLTSFVEVEDHAHALLFTLTFAEAVSIKNDAQVARGS